MCGYVINHVQDMPVLAKVADSVLVLVDIQERLAAAMPTSVRTRVVRSSGILVQSAAALDVPLIITAQYPAGLGPLEPALVKHLPANVHRIEKTCFSCANAAEFTAVLEQTKRRQVILCGMETHICILQTALDLQRQGYTVFVIEDAVSSRAKPNQENALARLRQAGVLISNMESILFEWLRDSTHEHFKMLSGLIR